MASPQDRVVRPPTCREKATTAYSALTGSSSHSKGGAKIPYSFNRPLLLENPAFADRLADGRPEGIFLHSAIKETIL